MLELSWTLWATAALGSAAGMQGAVEMGVPSQLIV